MKSGHQVVESEDLQMSKNLTEDIFLKNHEGRPKRGQRGAPGAQAAWWRVPLVATRGGLLDTRGHPRFPPLAYIFPMTQKP